MKIVTNGFGMIFAIDRTKILSEEIDRCCEFWQKIVATATSKLIRKQQERGLSFFFRFPESYKNACEQYLIYFAQFLADTGIEVDIQLNGEGVNTFFAVVPQNKDQALGHIQEALTIYLNAPESPYFSQPYDPTQDVAVTQWKATVTHLQSQLMFAQAGLQMKDAAIKSLELTNFQLTLERSNKASVSDDEPILWGAVSLTSIDTKKGAKINYGEMARILKRKLGIKKPPNKEA